MENRIKLTYNSEENTYRMQIDNIPKNVFTINTIESETHKMFSEGNWVFILFAGYSGYDLIMVSKFLDIADQYSEFNFALKPYMDDSRIQSFTKVNIQKKVTPILLQKNRETSVFLGSQVIKIEEAEQILNEIKLNGKNKKRI
ncbi:hypothetical protein [Tenacibaculum xiamenense]|uniref:hypothetical protein n=1 Tax=Tenacibaculum xiamenense TaxID=1261553 RepID=UPI0038931CF9